MLHVPGPSPSLPATFAAWATSSSREIWSLAAASGASVRARFSRPPYNPAIHARSSACPPSTAATSRASVQCSSGSAQ